MRQLSTSGALTNTRLFFWWTKAHSDISLVEAVHPPFSVELSVGGEKVSLYDHYLLWQKRFGGPKDLFRKGEIEPIWAT